MKLSDLKHTNALIHFSSMRSLRFFLPLLIVIFSSFFWEGDEKDLSHTMAVAKAHLQKQEFEEAKELYTVTLKRIDTRRGLKTQVGWQTYIDCVLQLVSAHIGLDELEQANNQLEVLLSRSPPQEFLPKIQLMAARLKVQNNDPHKAFLEMTELLETHRSIVWAPEELTYYHALSYNLDMEYEELLQKGRRLGASGFHKEALDLFQTLLSAMKKGVFPRARCSPFLEKYVLYLIAESYCALHAYDQSLAHLTINQAKTPLDYEMLYLAGVCYKKRKEYEKAVDLFSQYAKEQKGQPLENYLHAVFEVGFKAYKEKNYTQAKEQFLLLKDSLDSKERCTLLGCLYLSKIYLEEHEPQKALCLINQLIPLTDSSFSFFHELFHLQGEALFQIGDFENAFISFKKALEKDSSSSWRNLAKMRAGWCLLHRANLPTFSAEEKCALIEKSLIFFTPQRSNPYFQQIVLSRAKALLKLHELTEDLPSKKEAFNLILNNWPHFDCEGQFEGLLIQAYCSSAEQKECFLEQATNTRFAHLSSYGAAWQAFGLYWCHLALEHPTNKHFFEKAYGAFEHSFQYDQPLSVNVAHSLSQFEAPSLHPLIEKLKNHLEKGLDQSDHSLFVFGLLSAKLPQLEAQIKAQQALNTLCCTYLKSSLRDAALLHLGQSYLFVKNDELAKKTFLELVKNYPLSPYAPQALYLSLKCFVSLEEKQYIQNLLIEKYPLSPFAPLCVFEKYPFDSYEKGSCEALQNLQSLTCQFPDSLLAISAHYFLGHHSELLEKKQWHLSQAIKNPLDLSSLDAWHLKHYFLAKKELAESYPKNAVKERQKLLLSLKKELFKQRSDQKTFPLSYEVDYMIAQTYLEQGHFEHSVDLLRALTKKSEAPKSILFYSWSCLGRIAMQEDINAALSCFECALLSLPQISTVEHLELLLLKSKCEREKGDLEGAMRSLSAIINADVASSKKIEAMIQRAEIYILQKRPELAIRQLEAVAKKGGPWTEHALNRLSEYSRL